MTTFKKAENLLAQETFKAIEDLMDLKREQLATALTPIETMEIMGGIKQLLDMANALEARL